MVTKTKRKVARPHVAMLAIALILLYLALANVQSSTAKMMPAAMRFEAAQSARQDEMTVASNVLRARLAAYLHNDAQLSVVVEGSHLAVSLPPHAEPSLIVAEASRLGRVELVDSGREFLPVSSLVQTGPEAIPDQNVYQTVLSSADFEAAEARLSEHGRPGIEFTLSPAGDNRLAAHTTELRGYYLCLTVDDRVVNCPILRTPLTGRRGIIELTGTATLDDAHMLAMLLRSGPLPIPLKLADD